VKKFMTVAMIAPIADCEGDVCCLWLHLLALHVLRFSICLFFLR